MGVGLVCVCMCLPVLTLVGWDVLLRSSFLPVYDMYAESKLCSFVVKSTNKSILHARKRKEKSVKKKAIHEQEDKFSVY